MRNAFFAMLLFALASPLTSAHECATDCAAAYLSRRFGSRLLTRPTSASMLTAGPGGHKAMPGHPTCPLLHSLPIRSLPPFLGVSSTGFGPEMSREELGCCEFSAAGSAG